MACPSPEVGRAEKGRAHATQEICGEVQLIQSPSLHHGSLTKLVYDPENMMAQRFKGSVPYSPARLLLDPAAEREIAPAVLPYFLPNLSPG